MSTFLRLLIKLNCAMSKRQNIAGVETMELLGQIHRV